MLLLLTTCQIVNYLQSSFTPTTVQLQVTGVSNYFCTFTKPLIKGAVLRGLSSSLRLPFYLMQLFLSLCVTGCNT